MAPDCGKLADPGPKASLCTGDLEQAHYRDADHWREGYAPPNSVCPVGVVVVVVLVALVILDREVQDQLRIIFHGKALNECSWCKLDYIKDQRGFGLKEMTHNDNDGRRYLPRPLPEEPGVGIEAEHKPKILQELVHAVDPRHDGNLEASKDERRVGGRVVVDQLQDVDATVCHHAQTTEEHEETDAECAPPGNNHEEIPGIFSHLLFFPLRLGNRSRRTVMTVSTVENWVPKPRDKSIMKKRIDQRGEIGIRETASG